MSSFLSKYIFSHVKRIKLPDGSDEHTGHSEAEGANKEKDININTPTQCAKNVDNVHPCTFTPHIHPSSLIATCGISHGIRLVANIFCTNRRNNNNNDTDNDTNNTRSVVLMERYTYFLVSEIFTQMGIDVDIVEADADGVIIQSVEDKVIEIEVVEVGESCHGVVETQDRSVDSNLDSAYSTDNLRDIDLYRDDSNIQSKRKVKALYIVPLFSNPCGISLSIQRRCELLKLAYKYNFIVISDEAYGFLNYGELQSTSNYGLQDGIDDDIGEEMDAKGVTSLVDKCKHKSLNKQCNLTECNNNIQADTDKQSPNTNSTAIHLSMFSLKYMIPPEHLDMLIVLGSYSKIYSPGIRLGYILTSNNEYISALSTDGTMCSGGGPPSFILEVMTRIMDTGKLERYIDYLRHVYEKRFLTMSKAIDKYFDIYNIKVEYHLPTGGYFLWLKLVDVADTNLMFEYFEWRTVIGGLKLKLGSVSDQKENMNTEDRNVTSELNSPLGVTFLTGIKCIPKKVAETSPYIRLSIAFYTDNEIELGIERLAIGVSQYLSSNIHVNGNI